MAEKITLTYFDIDELGFRDDSGTELPLQSAIQDLVSWVNNQDSIVNTKVIERIQDSQILPVYCHGVIPINRNRTLFTLWNETPTYRGAIASLPMEGRVGLARASKTTVPADSIPGFPSYFMVLNNERQVINIKRENETVGSGKRFADYVEKFLRRFSSYVNFGTDENTNIFEREISHYLIGGSDENIFSDPFFRLKQSYIDTEVDRIYRDAASVYKLVRMHNIDSIVASRDGFIKDLLVDIGVRRPRHTEHNVRFKSEVDYAPTLTDLRKIVSSWKRKIEDGEDIRQGFRMRGKSNKVIWLDSMIKRKTVTCEIRSDNVIISEILRNIFETHTF